MLANCTFAETLGEIPHPFNYGETFTEFRRNIQEPGCNLWTSLPVTQQTVENHDHNLRDYYIYCLVPPVHVEVTAGTDL